MKYTSICFHRLKKEGREIINISAVFNQIEIGSNVLDYTPWIPEVSFYLLKYNICLILIKQNNKMDAFGTG